MDTSKLHNCVAVHDIVSAGYTKLMHTQTKQNKSYNNSNCSIIMQRYCIQHTCSASQQTYVGSCETSKLLVGVAVLPLDSDGTSDKNFLPDFSFPSSSTFSPSSPLPLPPSLSLLPGDARLLWLLLPECCPGTGTGLVSTCLSLVLEWWASGEDSGLEWGSSRKLSLSSSSKERAVAADRKASLCCSLPSCECWTFLRRASILRSMAVKSCCMSLAAPYKG